MCLLCQSNFQYFQIHVKSSYINSYLEVQVSVEKPWAIYVTRRWSFEAQKVWNIWIDRNFQEKWLSKCPNEHAVYCIEHENDDILFACLYMDDLILTGSNLSLSENFE